MLDSIQHISTNDADVLVGRMKMTIAGALICKTDAASVLSSLADIAGDSIDGPAVWGGNTTFENARAILERWQADATTTNDAVAELAEVLKA